ncbi:MAG: metal-dependent phosphohydrolase, partial [Elainellaceae cyanobacterium]
QRFGNSISIDADAVKTAIDFTRFPVPAEPAYQDIQSYPGLVRAADLIGQLADPAYLLKLPHLLEEMRETGTAQALGYHHPKDMLDGYLDFYRRSVYPYIQPALGYLNETPEGQDTIRRLYNNLAQSERDEVPSVGRFRQITIDELGRIS